MSHSTMHRLKIEWFSYKMLEPKSKRVCVRMNFLNKENKLTNSGPLALLVLPVVIFLCGQNRMPCSWVPVLKSIDSLIANCTIEDAKFSCSYPKISPNPFQSQYIVLGTKAQTLVHTILVETWALSIFDTIVNCKLCGCRSLPSQSNLKGAGESNARMSKQNTGKPSEWLRHPHPFLDPIIPEIFST